MKRIFLTIILLTGFQLSAQKVGVDLKKKFFGTYAGTIPAFQMDTGKDLVDVASERIEIKIDADSLHFTLGRLELAGAYEVLFEVKKYYVLVCEVPSRAAKERVVVYKSGKKISRDGLYPQPSAMLKKLN